MNAERTKPPVPVTADRLAEIRARAESGEWLYVSVREDIPWLLDQVERLSAALVVARRVIVDDRLHPGASDTKFGVPGCEACDAIAAVDAALAGGGEAA